MKFSPNIKGYIYICSNVKIIYVEINWLDWIHIYMCDQQKHIQKLGKQKPFFGHIFWSQIRKIFFESYGNRFSGTFQVIYKLVFRCIPAYKLVFRCIPAYKLVFRCIPASGFSNGDLHAWDGWDGPCSFGFRLLLWRPMLHGCCFLSHLRQKVTKLLWFQNQKMVKPIFRPRIGRTKNFWFPGCPGNACRWGSVTTY